MPRTRTPRLLMFRKDGRPVYEIMGAAEDDEDLDLLDQDGDAGDGTGDGDGDGNDDGPPTWWAGAQAALEQKLTSEIDRRIGQITRRPRPQQQGNQQQQQQPSGPAEADVREARAVVRDALAPLKLRPDERKLVALATAGAIRSRLSTEGDPELAGETVAREMEELVRSIRRTFQREIISTLTARGAIDQSKLKPGPSNLTAPRGGSPDPSKQFQTGVDRALTMQAQRGHVPTPKN